MIELETLNDPERTARTKDANTHIVPPNASATELTATPQSPQLKKEQRLLGRIQFATLCAALFMAGWNDGSSGPLLPRIQEVYHVNFTIVSLIFVCSCSGFVAGAVSNIWLTSKLGFGKSIVLGALFQVAGYSIQGSAPPFPLFVIGFGLNGFGMALQNAHANGFVAALGHASSNPGQEAPSHPSQTRPSSITRAPGIAAEESALPAASTKARASGAKMGFLHAAYGLGAFCSPLIATQFAALPGHRRWASHYLVSLGISVVNVILLVLVFRGRPQDDCLRMAGEIVPERSIEQERGLFRRVLRTSAVHLIALFVLIYVGVEVTTGGWIVTFIINVRGGGPSAGYISSGFFGGLMLGRVLLLWVNKKVGERRIIFVYSALAIALELTIWLTPSLIENAVAVCIVGVVLGPMYPIAMGQAMRVLPRWMLTGSIGWIAGVGQAGSALLPFLTGTLAQKQGIRSLQPL
ncbi:hypothetical protein D9619_005088 [Psilocybe cf. subviscida]|uniref:Major facilitator superfamily (MFS) profile domain-containing protein n=1 Tax=Psilocybe cf. subviscida TaxID=2480587 RepID=A0A8H5BRX5_9AGAR|nr:hypothetical protein D9619_005088 [Psilocybe cf. subviscida]